MIIHSLFWFKRNLGLKFFLDCNLSYESNLCLSISVLEVVPTSGAVPKKWM